MKAKLLLALIVSLLFCGSVQANPTFMALSVSPGETFEFDVVTTQVVSGLFSTTGSILVDWGDGNSNSYNGTDQVWSHDYGDAIGTRTVTITNAGALTKYRMDAVGANVQFALSDLPSGVVYFICTGSNTVSGSLSDLPSGVTAFYCSGSNTVSDYTTKTWTTKPATFKVIPTGVGGLDENEIDQLLIDLDDDLEWVAGNSIELTGTNAAPTAASSAARSNILTEMGGSGLTTN